MSEENKVELTEEEQLAELAAINEKRRNAVQGAFDKCFNSGSYDKVMKAHELMMTENIAMNLSHIASSLSNINNNVVKIGQLLEQQNQKNIITR